MDDLTWRKSSYSGQEVNCVELAVDAVRDSKNPTGGVLNIDVTAFVATVKAGRIVG